MTLSELQLIHHYLVKYSNSDACEGVFSALNYVKREIRLKELEALIPKEDPKEWR